MELFQVSVIFLLIYIAIIASRRLSGGSSITSSQILEKLSAIEARLDEIDMKLDELPGRDDDDFDLD